MRDKSLEGLLRETLLILGADETERLLRPILENALELGKLRRNAIRESLKKQVKASEVKDSKHLSAKQIDALKRKFTNERRR